MSKKSTHNGLFSTLIGKKMLMGITGIFLITFLVVHCAINSLIFFNDGGELFNEGAKFMGTNVLIRIMEVVLFLGIIAHIVDALLLTLANNKTRNTGYQYQKANANSKWYSRWMGLLGTLILMFLIVHLKDFWVPSCFADHIAHSELEKLPGQETLFEEMKEVFENPLIVILYVASMVSLAYHLLHGFQSAFQTMGWNHPKYTPIIQKTGYWFSIIISVLFALMPIVMHLGIIK